MERKTTNAKRRGVKLSRRDFMGTAAAAMAAVTIVPRHVLGGANNTAPSAKLNIAGVGVGGMGQNNIRACESENIVALCDVDWKYSKAVFKKYPKARKWKDFREMLPERPDDLEPGRRTLESGTIFVGDKGKIMCGTYSENARIIPELKMRANAYVLPKFRDGWTL